MTTVGYGDITPETDGGRLIAILVMVVGIGFLSLLIGAAAERFVVSDVEQAEEQVADELEDAEADVCCASSPRSPSGCAESRRPSGRFAAANTLAPKLGARGGPRSRSWNERRRSRRGGQASRADRSGENYHGAREACLRACSLSAGRDLVRQRLRRTLRR